MIIIPFHQFEIRYTKILNFQALIKEVIAPFVPMAIDVLPENESSVHLCRYTLLFSGYSIIITWDRVLIKTEGDLNLFIENNSIVEEPFFNLFNKIKALESFGNVVNCLCATSMIRQNENSLSEIKDSFIKTYLNKSNLEKITNPTDVAIVLETDIDGKQVTMQFGPYVGIADLHKRNIMPQNQEILSNVKNVGEMADVKIFETLKFISFAKYKDLIKMTIEYQNSLWKI